MSPHPSRPAGFTDPAPVRQPELERQSRRLAAPAWRFLALSIALAVPGVILVVLGSSWVWTLGIILLVFATMPLVVALGTTVSSGVGRWAARDRPFA